MKPDTVDHSNDALYEKIYPIDDFWFDPFNRRTRRRGEKLEAGGTIMDTESALDIKELISNCILGKIN